MTSTAAQPAGAAPGQRLPAAQPAGAAPGQRLPAAQPAGAAPGQRLPAAEVTRSDATLRAFLHGLPGVDQVGADARAAMLSTRSIKTSAKAMAIDLAIRMVDLTTLEGADTPGKVRALCAKAM